MDRPTYATVTDRRSRCHARTVVDPALTTAEAILDLEVAPGEGIDVLVTTDEPDVVYLHATDGRWLAGHAS